MTAPRGNGLATLLLIWDGGTGWVGMTPPKKTVSRLAYRGTNDLRKPQIAAYQPADLPFTGQRLSPRLAALFVFALDAMD